MKITILNSLEVFSPMPFDKKYELENKKELLESMMRMSKKDLCSLKLKNSMELVFTSSGWNHPDMKEIIEYNRMIDFALAEKKLERKDLYKGKK